MQANIENYNADIASRIGDVINNVAVVQSYVRISSEVAGMRATMKRTLDAQYKILTWWGLVSVMSRGTSTITIIIIFSLGSYLAVLDEISIGDIVSFTGFAGLLIGKLDQLSNFISRLFMETPTLRAYFALLDQEPAVNNISVKKVFSEVNGHVEFKAVSYSFDGGSNGVFDIDLVAEVGQTIALVGPTGAGKSTLMALLQGFIAPHKGNIFIDGQDITHIQLDSLRRAIAVVFQDTGLFNRSVGENIRFGKLDADQNALLRVAKLAQIEDLIAKKPGGLDFMIGERGALLSGGEGQRIAITRAILKNAPILILDEATSALDSETEFSVKCALDHVCKGRTTFIIAHRLSTIADADIIVVLEQGRIVERGNFIQLVKKEGVFARLVDHGCFANSRL